MRGLKYFIWFFEPDLELFKLFMDLVYEKKNWLKCFCQPHVQVGARNSLRKEKQFGHYANEQSIIVREQYIKELPNT